MWSKCRTLSKLSILPQICGWYHLLLCCSLVLLHVMISLRQYAVVGNQRLLYMTRTNPVSPNFQYQLYLALPGSQNIPYTLSIRAYSVVTEDNRVLFFLDAATVEHDESQRRSTFSTADERNSRCRRHLRVQTSSEVKTHGFQDPSRRTKFDEKNEKNFNI